MECCMQCIVDLRAPTLMQVYRKFENIPFINDGTCEICGRQHLMVCEHPNVSGGNKITGESAVLYQNKIAQEKANE